MINIDRHDLLVNNIHAILSYYWLLDLHDTIIYHSAGIVVFVLC